MKITDKRYKIWKSRCYHEMDLKGKKHCNKLLDEDTGKCPDGHLGFLHSCKTKCCIEWIQGNHKFCEGHRKEKTKSICIVTDRILRRYRSMMWGKLSKSKSFDNPEDKKEYLEWRKKQIESTYSKEYLLKLRSEEIKNE